MGWKNCSEEKPTPYVDVYFTNGFKVYRGYFAPYAEEDIGSFVYRSEYGETEFLMSCQWSPVSEPAPPLPVKQCASCGNEKLAVYFRNNSELCPPCREEYRKAEHDRLEQEIVIYDWLMGWGL